MVPAVSAPPAPSEDHLGREPGPKDPLPNPSLPSCACLPCDLGLAPFRSSLASPGRCGPQPRTGSSLPEAGRAGVGPLSSLWNGSKSGWGECARAEEIVAVVGVQLGQIGPYSAAEKEALSSAKQPPWDPAPNSIIFISLCPRLLEVGVEVGHGCPPFHPPLPPTPNNRVHAGRELLKGTGQGREEGPGRVWVHPWRSLIGNWGSPDFFSCKEPACQCRRFKTLSWIPGLGRSPGGGHGNQL